MSWYPFCKVVDAGILRDAPPAVVDFVVIVAVESTLGSHVVMHLLLPS